MTERDDLMRFAKDLADPDWSLSVPNVAKQTISKLVAIIEAKPPVITTADELDALPVDSVVLDRNGMALQKTQFNLSGTGWNAINGTRDIEREVLECDAFPATVIHEGTQP